MSDIKWIKITTDIFDDEKIMMIETLPEADAIIVIWFKLLCLAGKTNHSGVLLFCDRVAYTDKMLSVIFRRKESVVKLALDTFESLGMIQIVDNVITIPNWGKHQNIDSLENKREYMRSYMQKYRKKQEAIACKTNSKTNGKTNVSRTEKEVEEDKIVEDVNNNINNNNNIDLEMVKYNTMSSSTSRGTPEPKDKEVYSRIIGYLNEKTGRKFNAKNKQMQQMVNARLLDGYSEDDFFKVIDNKCHEWLGTEHETFLRPSTLFAPSHFDEYLNQGKVRKPGQKAEKNSDAVVLRGDNALTPEEIALYGGT